jgi:hypothetical protein
LNLRGAGATKPHPRPASAIQDHSALASASHKERLKMKTLSQPLNSAKAERKPNSAMEKPASQPNKLELNDLELDTISGGDPSTGVVYASRGRLGIA